MVDLAVRYARVNWQIKSLLALRLSLSGVDLFFVLSGFPIREHKTRPVLDSYNICTDEDLVDVNAARLSTPGSIVVSYCR